MEELQERPDGSAWQGGIDALDELGSGRTFVQQQIDRRQMRHERLELLPVRAAHIVLEGNAQPGCLEPVRLDEITTGTPFKKRVGVHRPHKVDETLGLVGSKLDREFAKESCGC